MNLETKDDPSYYRIFISNSNSKNSNKKCKFDIVIVQSLNFVSTFMN
jgi:hypothetical protein